MKINFEDLKAQMKESALSNTFEGRIEELETICLRIPGALPNRAPDARPKEHTLPWYAEQILFFIRVVRNLLKQGSASHAAAEALKVGVLAAEAQRLWPGLREWTKALDNESKERALVGDVMSIAAHAGQISRELSVSDYGLDMEIEFKSDDGKATGRMVRLQLKSGDSHLKKRKRDGAEIFKIKETRHADYWREYALPVWLVISNSSGQIRWMEIREYLKSKSDDGKKPVKQIVFTGEPFNVDSIRSLRDRMIGKRSS